MRGSAPRTEGLLAVRRGAAECVDRQTTRLRAALPVQSSGFELCRLGAGELPQEEPFRRWLGIASEVQT